MTKEVTTKQSTEVAVPTDLGAWGDVVVEQKDLVLPKILIQQALSEAVKQKKANDGDLLNTLTGEVLGTEVELLPFYVKQSVVIEKWNGKKFEFHSVIQYDGKSRPFEEEINGVRYKNSHMYEFFCLTSSLGLPHILPFKGTSNKVGKQLFTMMYVSNIAEKLTPAGKWIKYSTKNEVNKDGDSYYVSHFNPGKKATNEEVKECLKWIETLKNSKFTSAEEKESPAVHTDLF